MVNGLISIFMWRILIKMSRKEIMILTTLALSIVFPILTLLDIYCFKFHSDYLFSYNDIPLTARIYIVVIPLFVSTLGLFFKSDFAKKTILLLLGTYLFLCILNIFFVCLGVYSKDIKYYSVTIIIMEMLCFLFVGLLYFCDSFKALKNEDSDEKNDKIVLKDIIVYTYIPLNAFFVLYSLLSIVFNNSISGSSKEILTPLIFYLFALVFELVTHFSFMFVHIIDLSIKVMVVVIILSAVNFNFSALGVGGCLLLCIFSFFAIHSLLLLIFQIKENADNG